MDLSRCYYLDSLGRPKAAATHRAIARDSLGADWTLIYRAKDAAARGVPYGTPVDGPAPVAPTPPPAPAPAVAPTVAPPVAPPGPVAPPPPSWATADHAPEVVEDAPAAPSAPPAAAESEPEVVEAPPPPPPRPEPELSPEQEAALRAQAALVFGLAARAYGHLLGRVATLGLDTTPRALQPSEVTALAGALEACAAYYMPQVELGPLSALALVSSVVGMQLRADAERELAERRERAEREAERERERAA